MPAFTSLTSLRRLLTALVATALSLAACERSTSEADSSKSIGTTPRAAVAHDSTVSRTAVQSPPLTSDTSDPTATVKAYLTAVRARSATRDTLLWEPATGSDDGFRTFRDTTVTGFQVGTPGRIEGAAGSRYVDVPATVDLAAPTAPIRLRAAVTLRRAVVDGATDAQRRWRITRVEWGTPMGPAVAPIDSIASHR